MRDHPRLRHLAPHEQALLAEFLSWLEEKWGDRIAHVWLFGSKARGDLHAESDVDVLIVARDADDALREAVGDTAYDLSLAHGALLCEHVVSVRRFAQMRARQEPLYRNISREGIDLWALVHRREDTPGVGAGRAHRRPPGAVSARARHEEGLTGTMSGPLGKLAQVQQALDQAFESHGVVLAYLYGSQARGDAGPLSDVDVAVLFGPDVPESERFNRVLHLIGALGSVFHRDDVYVVDLAESSPLLRHRVYYDGRLLYCADDGVRVRFETTALRDYVDTEPLRKIKRKYVFQHFGSKSQT
ncbi:MAG TPA: nucleotidyltransferase domain-containing protein [Anaerolineae bacterium]|nr:nucleotidyltransferase domain-containing protein [Anaerolineae bacterium]